MKKAGLILIFLISISSCSRYSYLRSKSDIVSKNFTVTQKFDYPRRLIVLPVNINGKIYRMIFDTGASSTIVSREVADQLNLKTRGRIKTRDSRGQSYKLDMAILESVKIGEVEFTDILTTVIDWPENSVLKCMVPDGIIGNNLIRHANWLVDYKDSSLTLSDRDLSKPGMFEIPMKYGNVRPFLDITIDSTEIKDILLDLGSTGSLDISKKVFKEADQESLFNDYTHCEIIDGSTQGIFGHKTDSSFQYQIPRFQIGELSIYNAIAEIELKNKIGNSILKKTRLMLDYQNEKIGFLPYDSSVVIKPKNLFGFIPSTSGDSIYIASILKDGNVWKKGLRYGDKIEILNMELKSLEYCQFIEFLISEFIYLDSISFRKVNQPDVIHTVYPEDLWKN